MKNKVLINLYVLESDYNIDLYIPVNEIIWKIKKLLVKSVTDLSGVNLNVSNEFVLINKNTSEMYENNVIVINTDIRNATELILISTKSSNVDLSNYIM